jgi:hypothetical protein
MSPEMAADLARWESERRKRQEKDPLPPFADLRAQLEQAFAQLPEKVEMPYDQTAEGIRWAEFKKVCDPRFHVPLDPVRVVNKEAFERVVQWSGTAPGPCIVGQTGTGKTYAAWYALRTLYCRHAIPFAWFPAWKLISEMERDDKNGDLGEFFRRYDFFRVLFVDDIEKINWDFSSCQQYLWSFMDWAYRRRKPVIVTTNRDRKWWETKMREAFVRRMFDEVCVEAQF